MCSVENINKQMYEWINSLHLELLPELLDHLSECSDLEKPGVELEQV